MPLLTKHVRVQHEKKPVSIFESMQIVRIKQTSTKFLEKKMKKIVKNTSDVLWPISNKYICKIYKGREMLRHYVQADTLLFICYSWRYCYISCRTLNFPSPSQAYKWCKYCCGGAAMHFLLYIIVTKVQLLRSSQSKLVSHQVDFYCPVLS